ncbi:MGMT family protein [Wenzhouxiangella sp. AB-CW3]|uniref:MGMT family protein n=1 Tax=Wenzhouxiangella sp. AB-CW3 TaxID=2771012 RepID=UPI001CC2EE5E|nr:MGMT family protein [Wenzhouxiangella sp. AB-CW3]
MSDPKKKTELSDEDRYQRIWEVVAGIPEGCVLNYGEVARLARLPGKARLVGRALGRAPKRLALPWHRVVNAQGQISFPEDSSKGVRQRELLEAEGVEFVDDAIDLERFSPERAIDRMLWGPEGPGQ